MYSETFLDHLRHPRGQGALPDATHRAAVSDPTCGDELELDLRVTDGRVAAARFRVRGCPGAIAAGSALAVLLPGRAARPGAVTRDDLVAALGGVPPTKAHALRLALAVLAEALAPSGRARS